MLDTKTVRLHEKVILAMVEGLENTGERMLPDASGAETFWEHIYRYRFATRFVRARRVLDIACGEGYGTAALARAGAASVVGVDLSVETCEHARRKYGVDARAGDARCVPLPDQSMDVIVSFETVEHVDPPGAFLDECRRLLAPQGILVISTPNREALSDLQNPNPFHCAEMNEDEFTSLLTPRFRSWQWYTQRPRYTPRWSARTLAAEISPWHMYRKVNWLRGRCSRLCPHLGEMCRGAADEYRQAPVETILKSDVPFSCYVNPYAIMKRSRMQREQAYYFVVVARV